MSTSSFLSISQVRLPFGNSIYVTNGLTPDISVEGKNTCIFNNIFYADSTAIIGQVVDLKIEAVYMLASSIYSLFKIENPVLRSHSKSSLNYLKS